MNWFVFYFVKLIHLNLHLFHVYASLFYAIIKFISLDFNNVHFSTIFSHFQTKLLIVNKQNNTDTTPIIKQQQQQKKNLLATIKLLPALQVRFK